MVWIHGGGLNHGDSHLGLQGVVRNLVSKGVVVASLEYRMSWLG
jgi:carboxylesterase type B